MGAILLVLLCTVIGWLVGYALFGLLVGVGLVALATWAGD